LSERVPVRIAAGIAALGAVFENHVQNVLTSQLAQAAPHLGARRSRLAEGIEGEDAPLRVELAGSHLIGIAIARYVVRVEPLASADPEAIVAAVGPTIQRYLTGEAR
jgi:hypothetical protein